MNKRDNLNDKDNQDKKQNADDKADDMNDILTSEQVMELLGISRPTLSRRVRDKIITPLPKSIGQRRHYRLRFRRSDIEKFLNP